MRCGFTSLVGLPLALAATRGLGAAGSQQVALQLLVNTSPSPVHIDGGVSGASPVLVTLAAPLARVQLEGGVAKVDPTRLEGRAAGVPVTAIAVTVEKVNP